MANEEDEEYVMERIVEKRMKYGKPVYFIKWEGYPEEENTWEPREHINNQALIDEFEAGVEEQTQTAKRAATSRKAPAKKPTSHARSGGRTTKATTNIKKETISPKPRASNRGKQTRAQPNFNGRDLETEIAHLKTRQETLEKEFRTLKRQVEKDQIQLQQQQEEIDELKALNHTES